MSDWDYRVEFTVDDELVIVSGRRHREDKQSAYILVQGPHGRSVTTTEPLYGGTVQNVTAEMAAAVAYGYADQGCDVKRVS